MQHYIVVIICIYIVATHALILNVPNLVDIDTLTPGTTLFTQLSFDAAFASAATVGDSHVCLAVNGDICTCYHESYRDVVISLTDFCYDKLQQLRTTSRVAWLHLQLRTPSNNDDSVAYTRNVASTAVRVILLENQDTRMRLSEAAALVTLVLPLTLDDLSRASVLIYSLRHIAPQTVYELLVFSPDDHVDLLEGALTGLARQLQLRFPVHVHAESVLFRSSRAQLKQVYPYAIQMAVKLLAAQFVSTDYYVTLDADVVLLRPFAIDQLLFPVLDVNTGGITHSKAVYHFEERSIHENWWKGSERMLNLSEHTSYVYHTWKQKSELSHTCQSGSGVCSDSASNNINIQSDQQDTQQAAQGFGVTPAVLSTYGSLLTVAHLCRQLLHSQPVHHEVDYGDGAHEGGSSSAKDVEPIGMLRCERLWLDGFGRAVQGVGPAGDCTAARDIAIWSEYTMYRVVLDHLEVRPHDMLLVLFIPDAVTVMS